MKALYCSMLATRLRCDSAAPLDMPVVPPVYCRNSRSSPETSTGVTASVAPLSMAAGSVRVPVSRASTAWLGIGAPQPSPRPAVTTVFTPVLPITSASGGVEPS